MIVKIKYYTAKDNPNNVIRYIVKKQKDVNEECYECRETKCSYTYDEFINAMNKIYISAKQIYIEEVYDDIARLH